MSELTKPRLSVDLSGQVALVTGAARGLGRTIAEALARCGARLACIDINTDLLSDTIAAIRSLGAEAQPWACDVTDSERVSQVVDEVVKHFGQLDILVNNAGITRDGLLIRMKDDQWDAVLNINLKGTFLCCKAVLPVMKAQSYGKVVNLASVAGKDGNANMSAYAATKAAIICLTKTLGKEMAPYNVFVNCVAPALIETEMAREMTPEQRALLTSKIPLGRLGKPEEVASVVKFLVSEEASFVTGQCYDISGGRSVY
mgnify:CR=1 FL=1